MVLYKRDDIRAGTGLVLCCFSVLNLFASKPKPAADASLCFHRLSLHRLVKVVDRLIHLFARPLFVFFCFPCLAFNGAVKFIDRLFHFFASPVLVFFGLQLRLGELATCLVDLKSYHSAMYTFAGEVSILQPYPASVPLVWLMLRPSSRTLSPCPGGPT